MGCRGICSRLSARRPASGSAYDERCRCNACNVWMSPAAAASTGRCPCCRQRVRFARRGIGGRLRRAAGAFYDARGTHAEMSDREAQDSDITAPGQASAAAAAAPGGDPAGDARVPAGTAS